MEQSEIIALIKLIDDEDDSVFQNVRSKLLEVGYDQHELLREYMLRSESELQHQRLKEILGELTVVSVNRKLSQWHANNPHDLFEGFYIISTYRYPNLDRQQLTNSLDKIKLDIWLRLNYQFSPVDNIRVINEVFFGKYRFHGDTKNYYAAENSYLNTVLENRKGNPISLSILYSIIAQRLMLPVFGVDLPQHFVLAYKDDSEIKDSDAFSEQGHIPFNIPGDVLFYVNVFNGGAVFSKYNINRFLDYSSYQSKERYFEPCPNTDILLRVLRNLMLSYEKSGKQHRKKEAELIFKHLKGLSNK